MSSETRIALLFITWIIHSAELYSWHGKGDLNVILGWKQLDFDYPSAAERNADIASGKFNIGKLAPIDIDVHYATGEKTRFFITVPRTIQSGVPASIGTVSDKSSNGSHLIAPYPSWSWHRNLEECRSERIVSVFRTMIDECDRIWLVDTGKINETQTCPPQILAFDVNTDQLLYKYEIPSNLLTESSLFVTPVVDVVSRSNNCANTFVYCGDSGSFIIVVYDLMHNTSWAIHDKTFYPDPDYETFTIAGDSFKLLDGVLGMSLTPNKPGEKRRLFYHALSSATENWVYAAFLRNQTLFKDNPGAVPQIFHTYKNTRDTQSAAEAIDGNGILYFGLLGDIEIACFDTYGEYGYRRSSGIVGNNHVTMQFPGGMKVINNLAGKQELWTLTSRFQKATTGTLNTTETNFRVLAASVDTLISGTPCDNRGY